MMKGFCITINQQLLPCALKGLKFFQQIKNGGQEFFFNIFKMQNDHPLLNHQCVNRLLSVQTKNRIMAPNDGKEKKTF